MNELPRHARRKLQGWILVGVIACVTGTTAFAGAREDFYRRAAERDVETFRWLDRNNDGRLTKEEAHGNVDMQARFDDLDTNRDGVITTEELQRYIALRYGVSMP